ncbi:MAG TPA: HAD-IIB family hydrolase [Stellaceae bacterium]|nr:HAD-IIB family hydrolase [Stellaceae bacterium]
MYFVAFATDYDGTLAEDGRVAPETLSALKALHQSGRKLILVTGRELPELQRVFPEIGEFDLVVAENGALLYEPATTTEIALGAAPPAAFLEWLKKHDVSPLSVGRSIVATWEPNEKKVLQAIRELGLELQIIFNKGAVMVLPSGVNKASGLAAALDRLQLSPLNVVGIGDAENDHAFLRACGCAVAVANALPMVKEDAEIVTSGARGAGVAEVIRRLIDNDLVETVAATARQRVPLALDHDDSPIEFHPQAGNLLIAGTSGGGKSTMATGILERLAERGFQYCVIDPEGDYAGFEGAVTVGDPKTPPRLSEVLELLAHPQQSVIVSLTGIDIPERPAFFAGLLPELTKLRAHAARPHWLLIDEAHHMLPPALATASVTLPRELAASILVTVHPDHIAQPALDTVRLALTVGNDAGNALRSLCARVGDAAPRIDRPLPRGEALLWERGSGAARPVRIIEPHAQRLRHRRKYAAGELGEDASFYFRGPEGNLNLRAQNLNLFLQIAEGVDNRTWLYHLRANDYSRWLRDAIKDDELAAEVGQIEGDDKLDARESRQRIRAAVTRRYSAPA